MRPIAMSPTARRPSDASRGQVLVIVSIAFVVLIGMLGLAIDGGRGYWERRQAQNAADHAALAAAWASCHALDPATAGRQAATDNGFTHNGTSTWVEITGGSGTWGAVVRSRLSTTFASVLGFRTITAAGKAVARCASSTGQGFAIFAGGNNCLYPSPGKFQIEFGGSDNIITGAVHANGAVKVSGSDNVFDGSFTHVAYEDHHASTVFDPPTNPEGYPNVSGALDWPLRFERDDYRDAAIAGGPNMFYFNRTVSGADIAANGSGLYYATDKIDVDLSNRTLAVTLVSEKAVIISGSNMTLTPYMPDNLLAFSAWDVAQPDLIKRCDEAGVKLSGGNNSWKGFIYAPLSQVDVNGSSTSSVQGSIIAWSVKVSGSSVDNTAVVTPVPGPKVLELLE
jgi:Tfp pilus assembly protein PilX